MRRVLLASVTVCLLAGVVISGERGRRDRGNREERARRWIESQVEEAVENYALDDEQALKVRELYKDRVESFRKIWQGRERTRENRARGRAEMGIIEDVFRMKFIPMLEPVQLKVFYDQVSEDLRRRDEGRRLLLKNTLELEDDAWEELEDKLKKLTSLKADLYAKSVVARCELRRAMGEQEEADDKDAAAKAVAEEIAEIEKIKEEGRKKIDDYVKKLKEEIPADQWAQIVLLEIVD